jgi:hypothetical protein
VRNLTDDARAAYKADPLQLQERLRASRAKLPERFTPSISCGSATFLEALREALSPDTEEANTLEELGINAFRLMVSIADERLKADKRIFRANMFHNRSRIRCSKAKRIEHIIGFREPCNEPRSKRISRTCFINRFYI